MSCKKHRRELDQTEGDGCLICDMESNYIRHIQQLEKQAKSGYWYDRYVQLEIEKSKLEQKNKRLKGGYLHPDTTCQICGKKLWVVDHEAHTFVCHGCLRLNAKQAREK